MPPTSFADYEPSADGSGWYVYKKTSKWKFHPETGLYLHIKSGVYYMQKEGDPKNFRKIDDDDDPVVRKMKQSEEMRKAIQSTEFVQFGEGAAAAAAAKTSGDDGHTGVPAPAEIAPAPKPPDKDKDKEKEKAPEPEEKKVEGKVREWNLEKGFGFIIPLIKEDEETPKSIFVHLWNVVGSTSKNPINLREGARVLYKLGEQDGKPRAQEVVMLGKDGKPLPVHAGAQNLEEKRKSYFVTADTLGVRVHAESWPGKQIELQDRFTQDEAMDELGVYFGVFDGHGGAQVSELAAKNLHRNILAFFRQKAVQPASRDEKLKLAVREAFSHTDKEILSLSERKKFDSAGSTAVCAILHGNPKLGTALRLALPRHIKWVHQYVLMCDNVYHGLSGANHFKHIQQARQMRTSKPLPESKPSQQTCLIHGTHRKTKRPVSFMSLGPHLHSHLNKQATAACNCVVSLHFS